MLRTLKTGRISKNFFLVIAIACIPFQFWNSYDEIICVFCAIYIFYLFLKGKLQKDESKLILLLIVFIFVGIVSNMISRMEVPILHIATDALWVSKMFLVFIAFRHLFNKCKEEVAYSLLALSKILVLFLFVTALITQFTDIGMTIETRYGLSAYGFIWKNGAQTGWLISGCIACILIAEVSERKRNNYLIMAFVVCLLTTKGLVWALAGIFILLSVLLTGHKKFSIKTIIAMFVLCVLMSGYQIRTYLLNTESIRFIFLYYGFVTANRFFPLGSGFGTYGSDFATRNYSQLYYEYGFHKLYGMSESGALFTNDNYLAMVVGQFGYIGLVLFGLLLWQMFKIINSSKIRRVESNWCLAIFFTLVISMIASATSKSFMGVFATIFVALLSIDEKKEEESSC